MKTNNILGIVTFVVSLPHHLILEIIKLLHTKHALMITDHPNPQMIGDQLSLNSPIVPAVFPDFRTANEYLERMSVVIRSASQQEIQTGFESVQIAPSTSLQVITDLVIIDWAGSDLDPQLAGFYEKLRACLYYGCVLIRDQKSGKFHCQNCKDQSCKWESILDSNLQPRRFSVDDTVVVQGEYPLIR